MFLLVSSLFYQRKYFYIFNEFTSHPNSNVKIIFGRFRVSKDIEVLFLWWVIYRLKNFFFSLPVPVELYNKQVLSKLFMEDIESCHTLLPYVFFILYKRRKVPTHR